MNTTSRTRIAAGVMFLGIGLGAFGAHGLADQLAETGRLANWETATLYHLIHGLALFAVARSSSRPLGYGWFLAGIVLFSGSLYVLALTGITKFGAITPLGGLCFLIGWGRWIFAGHEARETLR
jgi:uncharacterized membrane protein YgdD (TMEM256/DUF423 family)